MSLAALFELPRTDEDWYGWGFNHAAIHYTIVTNLQNQTLGGGIPKFSGVQQFMLHPMNLDNIGIWLYWHQTMHNQANQAIGSSGYDLLELDLKDSDSVQEWLLLNGDEHQRFNAALGVD